MTPEQEKMLKEVHTWFRQMQSSSTVPFTTQTALSERLIKNFFGTSTKSVASETQAVNESGSSGYSVAKPMDGFKLLNDGGVPIFIPYYL